MVGKISELAHSLILLAFARWLLQGEDLLQGHSRKARGEDRSSYVHRGPRRGRTVHSSDVGLRVVQVVSARTWPKCARVRCQWPRRCCLQSIFLGGWGRSSLRSQSTTTTTCAAAEGVLLCAAQFVRSLGRGALTPRRHRPLVPSAPSRT